MHNPLVQLTLARVRELLREPEAIFWIFVFPILLALALGIAFRTRGGEELVIGVRAGEEADWVVEVLDRAPEVRAHVLTRENAERELRAGRVALVVLPGDPLTYWYDPTRPESRLARLTVDDAIQRASGRGDARAGRAPWPRP